MRLTFFRILECCLYVEAREQLTNNLQFLNNLIIETLLFGDDSLSEKQNSQIFKSVQLTSCTLHILN